MEIVRRAYEDGWYDREPQEFWNQLSSAIRERVVNAESVKEANTALRERFAAIYVTSCPGGTPRLDFVLRDREPGAPVVSSRLWADDPDEERSDDDWLVDFVGESAPSSRSLALPSESDRLTFVWVHPVTWEISAYE